MLTVPIIVGIERLFKKITVNNIKIILVCVYISPDASSDMYSNHCGSIDSIYFKFPEHNFVIADDFNLNTFN